MNNMNKKGRFITPLKGDCLLFCLGLHIAPFNLISQQVFNYEKEELR